MPEHPYDESFFGRHAAGSLSSARAVLPLLFEYSRPASVVDVGCGRGAWLKAAAESGTGEIAGLDGPWVERGTLLIPPSCFVECDLAQPIPIRRRFDLAISVEVAEHLPYARSEGFVADLCALSDLVLFSAAMPYQGGVGHVNEQWLEFWAILFRRHGYVACDVLREPIWPLAEVEFWYKQNLIVFAKAGLARGIFPAASLRTGAPLSVCHPMTLAANAARIRPQAAAALEMEFSDYAALVQAYVSGAAALPPLKLPASPLFPRCRAFDGPPPARPRRLEALRRLAWDFAAPVLARLRGVKPGGWFDARYYLECYPDVARSGMNPLAHYLLFGIRERRRPRPYLAAHEPPRASTRRKRPPADPGALEELAAALAPVRALVSIVIPNHNYGAFLREAVDSALAQTYPQVEVIAVDDGSTEPEALLALDELRDPRVRVLRQENRGLARARNRGAAAARGEYVLFLDADDRLHPRAVALLLHALVTHPETAYAYPAQRFFGDEELVWTPQEYNAYDLLWSNHPSVCSLIRREALEEFSAEMDGGYEDWEYWLRLSGLGRHGVCVPAPVFEHRRHGVTMTHTARGQGGRLCAQIRALNAGLYRPEAVAAAKLAWRPLVSVVIPYYNGGAFLRETLDSLAAQTTQDFETILVDDGSDDPASLRALEAARIAAHDLASLAPGEWGRSPDLRRAPTPGEAGSRRKRLPHVAFTGAVDRLRVIHTPHRGPAAARNAGAREARAEFLMFLDCDDLLDPGALEKLGWTLAANPGTAFVYSGVRHFGEIEAVCYDDFDPRRLRRENYLAVTAVLRREVFFELGGFDESFGGPCEDYDFWLRLVEAGHRGQLFREPLFSYRRHSAGRSAWCHPGAAKAVARRRRTPVPAKAEHGLLERAAAALDAGVEEQHYRRPNLPGLFSPERWDGSRVNLLYLIPGFDAGGAEAFDLRILSCLPRERFRVTVVSCGETGGPWYDEFKAAACEIYSLGRMTSPEAFLRYLMIAKSVDVVFNRNTRAGYELAAEWPRVTRQVRYADLLHLDSKDGWAEVSARYHDKLDLCYVVSEDLERAMRSKYGLPPQRLRVLYFGLEESEMNGGPDGARAVAPLVGFIGRFTEQKDPLRWLSVAARVAAAEPAAAFLMVGDGGLLPECRKAAKRLGIADRVRFEGYRRDAAACCAGMDALLVTSRYEGLPLAILESLARGTPVVAPDVGGIRECLPDGLGVLLDPRASDEEFAGAVLRACCMKAGPAFASRARDFLRSRFSKQCMQARLERDLGALAASLDREQRLADYQLEIMAAPLLR